MSVEDRPEGVCLSRPGAGAGGIGKSLEIHLHPEVPVLTLVHTLHNQGAAPVEVAPWAITQLPLGGSAYLPEPIEPVDEEGLLPNRRLALWPYSRWDDPRFRPGDRLLQVAGEVGTVPFKLGHFNRYGRAGYLYPDGTFLLKEFAVEPEQTYPDFNSNVEVYVWDRFLELETLGPLATLAPGERATHQERWHLHQGVDPAGVLSLLEGTE